MAFLRGLLARGLTGVRLVVSDAHEGLKAAIGATLSGAAWQRWARAGQRRQMSRAEMPSTLLPGQL